MRKWMNESTIVKTTYVKNAGLNLRFRIIFWWIDFWKFPTNIFYMNPIDSVWNIATTISIWIWFSRWGTHQKVTFWFINIFSVGLNMHGFANHSNSFQSERKEFHCSWMSLDITVKHLSNPFLFIWMFMLDFTSIYTLSVF